jgi:hypothetical protein
MAMTEMITRDTLSSLLSPAGQRRDAGARAYQSPSEVLGDPYLDNVEKREILAFWASDACAVDSQPSLRQPPGADQPVPYREIMAALRLLDGWTGDGPPFGGGAAMRPVSLRPVTAAVSRGAGPGPGEPGLDELMADPLVRRLMARDGTSEAEVRALLVRVARARQGLLRRVA